VFTRLFRILRGNRDALLAAGLYVLGYAIVVIVVVLGEIALIGYPIEARDIPAYQAPNFFGNAHFESQVAKQFSPLMRLALFLRVVGSAYVIAWIFVRVVTAIAARRRPMLASVRARVTLLGTVAVIAWMALFGTLRADVIDRYGGVIHYRGLTLSQYYEACDRTKNPAPSDPKCALIASDLHPGTRATSAPFVPPTRDEAAETIAKFLHDNPPISDRLYPGGPDVARFERVGAVTIVPARDRAGLAQQPVRVADWARPFLTPAARAGYAAQFALGTCTLARITSIDTSEHRGTMPFYAVTYRKQCADNELSRRLRDGGKGAAYDGARIFEARAYLVRYLNGWGITDPNLYAR
jgi:hypothetical protein